MDIDCKQCPVCGAGNPKNNSECCRCHNDMTNVPLPLFEDDGKPLPEQGYQPTLTVDEIEYIILLGCLAAVAQISVTILAPEAPQYIVDPSVKLRRQVVTELLRRKFQRTPTQDEIITMESSMVPATMLEGVKRFNRLMHESTARGIDDFSPEIREIHWAWLS